MGKGKVLVVDDDENVQQVMYDTLTKIGNYDVDIAVDGYDGLEKIKNSDYDLVFTDLMMPNLDGYDFIKEATKVDQYLPIVAITGYASIENAVTAMKNGAKDFITKPFKISGILQTSEKLVGERKLLRELKNEDNNIIVSKLNQKLFNKLQEITMFQIITNELDMLIDNRELYDRLIEMFSKLLLARKVIFGTVNDGKLTVKKALGFPKCDIDLRYPVWANIINFKNYKVFCPGEDNPLTGKKLNYSLLVAPMVINNEVFAIIAIGDKADSPFFTDDEIALALSFIKKVVLKIENNALYDIFFNNLANTLKSLVTSIEARDPYTKDHSVRVTKYSLDIAEIMNISQEEKDVLNFGGYLHDVGKIGVRDTVLLKNGPLTDEEFCEIRQHPVIGDNILKPLNFFTKERELIRYHHEKFDGKGYPDSLSGEKIPLIVRIISVADTYDAITSSRPYRQAKTHEFAISELLRCKGTQFDPLVVEAFFKTPAGQGIKYEI